MSDEKVLDFTAKRNENIEKKRRAFERVLFQNFLGAYSVIDDHGTLYPITLVDISANGCLFQVPLQKGVKRQFPKDTEVQLRMYFMKNSFIPVVAKVRHGKEIQGIDGQTYMQYGCEFDQSLSSFKAMSAFVEFLSLFAEHSVADKGASKVFYL